jgi:putative Ca2+/H+ antiporter (TMEM165/GDT1 family)
MDWKLVLTTFSAIFLAEMGDKTQLAVFTLTASSHRPWSVFLGGALALTLVTALGVLVGGFVTRFIPAWVLPKAAALIFIAIGLWTWFKG